MTYVVIRDFKDLKDNDRVYRVGDVFPHPDSAVETFKEGRMAELLTDQNKVGEPLLAEANNDVIVEEEITGENQKDSDTNNEGNADSTIDLGDFPKSLGGGVYELSDGEKVRGKEKAVEAEAALKAGE